MADTHPRSAPLSCTGCHVGTNGPVASGDPQYALPSAARFLLASFPFSGVTQKELHFRLFGRRTFQNNQGLQKCRFQLFESFGSNAVWEQKCQRRNSLNRKSKLWVAHIFSTETHHRDLAVDGSPQVEIASLKEQPAMARSADFYAGP